MEVNDMKTLARVKIPIIDLKKTGENITKMRKDAGLSVSDLQYMLDLTSPQAIYGWQQGKYLPSIDNLFILSAVLGVKIEDIVITS